MLISRLLFADEQTSFALGIEYSCIRLNFVMVLKKKEICNTQEVHYTTAITAK